MSYNLVEKARKLAKLPAFTRNGVNTDTKRVTQDMFADFAFAVDLVGRELAEERDAQKDEILQLKDVNIKQALEINRLERKQWASSVKNKVEQAATSLDLEKEQTAILIESVSA